MFVSTKKHFQLIDVYAIIKITKINKNMIYGTVQQYIGEVGNLRDELSLLKFICTDSWTNNKNFKDLSVYKDTDITPNRTHINKHIVSIDPIGCVDIDDAIHIELHDNYYEVGIHIADVSSYIEQESDLDRELQTRAETIYLPNQVVHMLPTELSTEIYTLKKDKLSRAFSVIFKISNETYNVIDVQFVKSLITVKENLSYEDAEHQYLQNNNTERNIVRLIYDVGEHINKKYYQLDNYDIHKMVEVFMLLTNQTVAETLYANVTAQRFCILRVHDGCDDNDQFHSATEIDKLLLNKYKLLHTSKAIYALIQPLIQQTSIENNMFHKLLGNTLVLSHNSITNKGILYTHFTSPIRRYIDIIVHRMLYNCIYDATKITSITQQQIDKLNIKHSEHNKYEKIGINLVKIYDIQNKYPRQHNIYTANIINLDNESTLYINQLDMIVHHRILPKKIEDLFVTEKVNNKLIIKRTNDFDKKYCTIELQLFQLIKIQLVPTTNEWSKIKIQIVDPNFRELYYDLQDEFSL
jgi:exoribonuclease R